MTRIPRTLIAALCASGTTLQMLLIAFITRV